MLLDLLDEDSGLRYLMHVLRGLNGSYIGVY
jgi:hypothetical protein